MSFPLPPQRDPIASPQSGRITNGFYQYLARLLRDIGGTLDRLEQNDEVIRNILLGLGALEEDLDDIITGEKTFTPAMFPPPLHGVVPEQGPMPQIVYPHVPAEPMPLPLL